MSGVGNVVSMVLLFAALLANAAPGLVLALGVWKLAVFIEDLHYTRLRYNVAYTRAQGPAESIREPHPADAQSAAGSEATPRERFS